jgi:autotransporter-associated beta strand protein
MLALGCLSSTLHANVLMSIGTATGANTKIDTANAYTYNFGITSAASGLNLSQISMQVGKSPNQSNPIIVQIYSGFGGNVGGNQLIHTTELAASSFSGTSTSAYTLNLSSALSLAPGAYSVRLTSAASTTTSYLFRDGLLALGGGVVSQSQWIQDSNTSGSAGSTITPAAGYILADHRTSTESIDLGRYHASGSGPTSSLTLTNSAPATTGSLTESLTVAQGTVTGSAQVSGLPGSYLTQGSSQGVNVGISGAGSQSGSVQLNFNSVKDGSSSTRATSGAVSVGSRTIALSGFGYTGQSEWNTDANGSWSLANYANWDNAGGTPGMDGAASIGDTALFGSAATANRTISLNGNNPNLRTLTFDNASADYTIATGSGGNVTLGNATHAGTLTNSAGAHRISAGLTLGNNLSVSNSEGSSLQVSGSVTGNSYGLTKSGAGRFELSGGGSFGGNIVASAGTLVINGASTTSAASTSIQSDATLMGSGTISGNTTISGTHAPGNSPGVQTFADDLTYTVGSSVVWELIDNTIAGRGTNYDGIDVGGNLSFTGSTTINLDFALAGSTVNWSDSFWDTNITGTSGWKLFDVTGSISGFEDNLQLAAGPYTDGSSQSLTSVRSDASFYLYKGEDGIYLNYSAVPEPSAAVLAALSAIGLLRRKRS